MNLLRSKIMPISLICVGLLVVIALSQSVQAGAECASLGGACDDDGWNPVQKLDEIGTGNYQSSQASPKWPEKSRQTRWNMSYSGLDSEDRRIEMIEIDEISNSDVLLDVSANAAEHISGSLAIPYNKFQQDDSLKSVNEIAEILGRAGISQDDSLVIYGECLPCGGGPSASTYVYWMMKSLGHENVRILNGYVQDWKERGLPTSSEAIFRPAVKYTPAFTDRLVASYDYVNSGMAQVIDARTVQEYGTGSIPDAISIPYESILDGDKIKNESELEKRFSPLDKERPAVVFTNTGFKASVVWFALKLMGFDAKLYSYEDWNANQADEQNSRH